MTTTPARLGKVMETGPDGVEIRKHVPFSFKGNAAPVYYVWQKDATVALASRTLAGAREMGGLAAPKMSDRAQKRMIDRHEADRKRQADAAIIATTHKGRAGIKTNNKGLSR